MKKERDAQGIERYEELKQFRIKNWHCEGTQKYSDNPSLGMWEANIRYQYKLLINDEFVMKNWSSLGLRRDIVKCLKSTVIIQVMACGIKTKNRSDAYKESETTITEYR